LEYLEPISGVGKLKNVYPFIIQNFDKPNDLSEKSDNVNNEAKVFLLQLSNRKLIRFEDNGDIDHICNANWTNPIGNKRFQFWFDTLPIKVKLSSEGQEYLRQERVKNILTETNISTKKTNDAVQKSIKYQIAFGVISTAAIGLTAIIAVMAYNKGDSENLILIRKSMQQQARILDSIRLSQKESSTYLKIMAKKTSTKKK
ncbi:MAG: hypothetical protein ACXVB0_14070, partial [Mucilaginibacter sp.]